MGAGLCWRRYWCLLSCPGRAALDKFFRFVRNTGTSLACGGPFRSASGLLDLCRTLGVIADSCGCCRCKFPQPCGHRTSVGISLLRSNRGAYRGDRQICIAKTTVDVRSNKTGAYVTREDADTCPHLATWARPRHSVRSWRCRDDNRPSWPSFGACRTGWLRFPAQPLVPATWRAWLYAKPYASIKACRPPGHRIIVTALCRAPDACRSN